jgi:DNA-binding NtrC family response regulator
VARECSEVRVIVVDDDEGFRTGLAANLVDDGHVVRAYAIPAEMPDTRIPGDVQIIVIDYQMAGCDGLRFADAVHEANPGLPVVLVTAYWTRDLEVEIQARSFLSLCRKPVYYDELHALLHELVSNGHA